MSTEYLTSMSLNYDAILKDLQPCDIVEFNRLTYSHYAFHIGNGIFIHVTGDEERGLKGGDGKGLKCAQKFHEIANGSPCRINNLEGALFWKSVGSAGSDKVPNKRSLTEAKRIACEGIALEANGEPKLGLKWGIRVPYHLLGWNCERYSTHWKYECDGFSQQAYNGLIGSTVGNYQRVYDAAAASCFDQMKDAPIIAKPFLAVGGGAAKGLAVLNGTAKTVADGSWSLMSGAFTGVKKLFN